MNTYIIAEMAWGHTGSLQNALDILQGIKDAGAQAIGIHLTDLETYMTKDYRCLVGQTLSVTDEDNSGQTIYEYLDKINLSPDEWREFAKHAQNLEIDIIAMCNDMKSFEFSRELPIKKYVISAASFLESDLIDSFMSVNPNLVVRIGGATLPEIDALVDYVLAKDDKATIELLIGIQLYPTPISQMYIGSIAELKKRYNDPRVLFGLADHIDGDDENAKYLPALALPYGIQSIEKHITTAREAKLEDFEAALSIKDFKTFVQFIQNAEDALGDENLAYLTNDQYQRYRMVSRKKVVANAALSKGATIKREDVTFMRADSGCQLSDLPDLLGKTLKRDIQVQEGLTLEDVE